MFFRLYRKYKLSFLKRVHLLFGTGFSVQNVYNCKWLIDWSNSVDKNLSVKKHEDEQINFLRNELKYFKPDIFLDIGAHGGLYSVLIKKEFPNTKVYSFEPDRQNRYQLYSNIFLNNLENSINVFNIGLSNYTGEASFGIKERFRRGGKGITDQGTDKINVDTLDNLLKIKNKKCFIKIDVEGHEKQVLQGSMSFMKDNFCLVQTEILNKENEKDLFNIFADYKYTFFKKIDTSNAPDYYFIKQKIN